MQEIAFLRPCLLAQISHFCATVIPSVRQPPEHQLQHVSTQWREFCGRKPQNAAPFCVFAHSLHASGDVCCGRGVGFAGLLWFRVLWCFCNGLWNKYGTLGNLSISCSCVMNHEFRGICLGCLLLFLLYSPTFPLHQQASPLFLLTVTDVCEGIHWP